MIGRHRTSRSSRRPRWPAALVSVALVVGWTAGAALAAPIDQAKRMHDRLVGVPPSPGLLADMTADIAANRPLDAAYRAMDAPEGVFYTSSLRNWITPWTNEAMTVFAPLNDYSATVIGIIRDDRPFTDVLTANLVYVAGPGVVSSNYSQTDNDMYEELQSQRLNLGDPAVLVPMKQSDLPGAPIAGRDAAGIMTTRAAAEAFFSGGTNRAMWRFTSINYLCRDLEDMRDPSRPVDRIRQDINRSPGGDSEIFHNSCVACHSGMDPLAGAFAYFDWDEDDERLVHTPGEVRDKYFRGSGTFPWGYITLDNRWDNYWRSGPNAALGWRSGISGGYGAKSLGEEIGLSRAFSICQVEKVFNRICLRPPGDQDDRDEVDRIADVFEGTGYSMKRVFAEVASYCMGD
ncbi:MAG: hypothetical protein ACQGVK_00725 [Myxococcota bacterium]